MVARSLVRSTTLAERNTESFVGVGRSKVEKTSAASVAIANHIRLANRFDSLHRGQTWMTRTHTHQPDPAHTTMPIPPRDTEREIRAFG